MIKKLNQSRERRVSEPEGRRKAKHERERERAGEKTERENLGGMM